MLRQIIKELRHHIPFTIFGAITGIIIMLFSWKLPSKSALNVFYVFHPMHVFLSALVTASMYKLHKCAGGEKRCHFLILVIIGYVGSVGICTLSDSIIPYLGEGILGLANREIHVGFIEKWRLVDSAAILGILAAWFKPTTKFSHAAHVLVSTWASLFHIIMALNQSLNMFLCLAIFFFLFVSVWVPCCLSDIVFPLLFVKPHKH